MQTAPTPPPKRQEVYALSSYHLRDQHRIIQLIEKVKVELEGLLTRNYGVRCLRDISSLELPIPHKQRQNQEIRIVAVKVWDKAQNQRIIVVGENNADMCYEV